ncbi:MAG: rod shape-determining protein MreC [Anaerolineales bacterium]
MRRDSGPWLPWALLFIALLSLALHEAGALQPVENILSFVVTPVERGVSNLLDTLSNLTQTARDVRHLQQQVEALQETNNALVQENIRLREYQAEIESLRAQLNFAQENPTYGLVGADIIERGCEIFPCGEVVGEDTNPYLRYIIINTGSRQGVAVGMPVVTGGSAMVGRIARVSPNLSYVQLLNDPQSQVAAMLQQSRVTGLAIGTAEGNIVMTDILPDEEVNPGETVITSAAGGVLPRGLILGQVDSVAYQESELFQEAILRPAIHFRRMETVLVITDFPQPDIEELQEAP